MPIKITTERVQEQSSLPNVSRPRVAGFVGVSLGGNLSVVNYPMNLAVSDGTTDTFTGLTLRKINKVAQNINDSVNVWNQGTDYSFTTPNSLIWLNNPMTPPDLEGSLSTGGTGLDTTGINYAISVLDQNSEESTLSNTIRLVGISGSSHVLNWTKVPFASGYKVYDTTANALITTITNPNTVTYNRTTNAKSNVTLPVTNKARRVPKTGTGSDSTYFTDFTQIVFNYNPTSFTTLGDVENSHGSGSDITNMARIGFKSANVSEMYICATDGTVNSSFLSAIDKLANIEDITDVFALKDSTTVENYVVQHAVTYSSTENKKERFGWFSPSNSLTSVGDNNTAGTIRYRLNQIGGEKRAVIPVVNGNIIYADTWQSTDGTFTDNVLVPNHFLAGAVAFQSTALPDTASSLVLQFVNGFNFGSAGAPWNDSVEENKIEGSGGLYVFSANGRFKIYNDNTNSNASTEDHQRSVLTAEDDLRKRLRGNTEQYIGRKITDGLIQAVWRTTRDTLSVMVRDVLIRSFNEGDISVEQDKNVPTRINVFFKYVPIYPLLQLSFKYSFDI